MSPGVREPVLKNLNPTTSRYPNEGSEYVLLPSVFFVVKRTQHFAFFIFNTLSFSIYIIRVEITTPVTSLRYQGERIIFWGGTKFFILCPKHLSRGENPPIPPLVMVLNSGVRRKFSWGVSFSGIWWLFVFGVRCLWRHNLTSFSCFQTNVLAKFVDIIYAFVYTHSS